MSIQIAPGYVENVHSGATSVELRAFYSTTQENSDGGMCLAGSPYGFDPVLYNNYVASNATLSNGVVTWDAFSIDPTTDSDQPNNTVGFYVFNKDTNRMIAVVAEGLQIPSTPLTTSIRELKLRRQDALTPPAEMDGLIAWGMADRLSGSNDALIASVSELSGSGATIAQSNADHRPTLKIVSGVRFLRNSDAVRGLVISGLPQFDTSKCTLVAVGRKGGANAANHPFKILLSPVGDQYPDAPLLGHEWTNRLWGAIAAQYTTPTSKRADTSTFSFVAVSTNRYASGSPGKGELTCVDGSVFFRHYNQRGQAITENLTGRLSTTAFVGGWSDGSTFGFEGDYQAWAIFNRALSESELLSLYEYFAKILPSMRPYKEPEEAWYFEGDSMTTGALFNSTDIAFPERVLMTRTNALKSYNVAVLGQTIAQALADQATQVTPLITANKNLSRRVLVLWAGTNDIQALVSPATVYANLVSYITAAKAADSGLKVIVLTMLPRQADATAEANRLTYNTSIRNGASANGYTVADIASDPDIGAPGAQSDTDFYNADTIHLLDAGYQIVAEGYVIPAVSSLF